MSYPLLGDSDEVRNLIQFALEIPGARVTCTTDHKLFASFLHGMGIISMHRRKGTHGTGLAIDVGGTEQVRVAVFNHFLTYASKLHELIHTQMGYSIKDGRKVPPIAAKDHYDHVHISVAIGVRLPLKTPAPSNPANPPTQQEAPPMMTYDPISGGNWTIDETGAVFANDGAPYLGGLNAHPEWSTTDGPDPDNLPDHGRVAGISFWKGDGTDKHGNGYVIAFRFLNSPQPSLYHFDRARTGKS